MHRNSSPIWQEDLASLKKVAPVYFFFCISYVLQFSSICFGIEIQEWGQNFLTEGLELPTGGLK